MPPSYKKHPDQYNRWKKLQRRKEREAREAELNSSPFVIAARARQAAQAAQAAQAQEPMEVDQPDPNPDSDPDSDSSDSTCSPGSHMETESSSGGTTSPDELENGEYPFVITDAMREAGNDFDAAVLKLGFEQCSNCTRRQLLYDPKPGTCDFCKKNPTKFTAANHMNPGPVPKELEGLTMIEQMLIARIHPIISLFRRAGGELHYSGNVINFRQDITSYARLLPHDIENLDSVIIFEKRTFQGIAQFTARAGVIRRALQWLKRNNRYYSDIVISEENLARIPPDGDVTSLLPFVEDNSDGDEQNLHAVTDESDIHASYVPLLDRPDQQKRIFEQLNLPYPVLDGTPICEFTEEGYIVRAFPTLFPYGRADINYPRQTKVTTRDYYYHLMLWPDGRFAKDPRFRFFAMNTVLRQQAIQSAGVFLRSMDQGLTVQELKERVANNPDFIKRLLAHCSTLRSTRPYWRKRCVELLAMVQQIGRPTIFCTFSAADHHYPDIYRLICQGTNMDYRTLNSQQRAKLLRENPLVSSWYFEKRCCLFIDKVLKPLFKVKDYWVRYEWQWRGSPHMHGLLWLEDAPEFDEASMTDEMILRVRKYFDKLCSATIFASQHSDIPPSQLRFSEIDPADYEEDLGKLLYQFQFHSRCSSSCLRKDRSGSVKCRYKFPKDLRRESALLQDDGYLQYEPARNNDRLAKYNYIVTQIWRANTDFAAVVSMHAILQYIVKYAAKGEMTSPQLDEALNRFSEHEPNESSASRVLHRAVIATLGDRDYSSQEVIHILMGWPLFHATRDFITLNLNAMDENLAKVAGERLTITKNKIQHYMERDRSLERLSLTEYTRWYYKCRGKDARRRKSSIVRAFPLYKLDGDPGNDEKYFRQMCILHHPFRHRVAEAPPSGFETWQHFFTSTGLELPEDLDLPEPLNEGEVLRSTNELDVMEPAMGVSQLHENSGQSNFGQRLIDVGYDWTAKHSISPTMDRVRQFLGGYRSHEAPRPSTSSASSDSITFSREQQEVLQICSRQLNGDTSIKRVVVQGEAGCGKSTIIKEIVRRVTERYGADAIAVIAPTGVAALNIDGETIHSLLRLPADRRFFAPLTGRTSLDFQGEMRSLRYLIVDEVSMVGLRLVNMMEKRCKEINPDNNEPFGGLFVYFFGDYCQLPPVLNAAVYSSNLKDPHASQGLMVFRSFQKRLQLTQSHRQHGPDTQAFRDLLDRLARGEFSPADYNLLMTRREGILPQEERSSFRTALRLLPTNESVVNANENYIRKTKRPVAHISSVNHPDIAETGRENNSIGLPAVLNVSEGCRVMLRKNLWVAGGLVNGALGTLRRIVYSPGNAPPMLPDYVLVEFDQYNGPSLVPQVNAFPIVPITRNWIYNNMQCSRRMLPLSVAHAVTIHKSQGLTLRRIVLDVGKREISVGQTYVGLSRVRSLNDVMLIGTYSGDRFQAINNSKQMLERKSFLQSAFSSNDREERDW